MVFNVDVSWRVLSSARIEAENEEAAKDIAYRASLRVFDPPSYLDDSFTVDDVHVDVDN